MNVVTADVETRTFSVTVDGIAAMDTWLEHLADQWKLSEKAAFGARLCLAELAANVLEHGTARSSGGDHIIVTVDRLRDGIEVEFRDLAGELRPDESTPPAGNPRQRRGSGSRAPSSICARSDLRCRAGLQSHNVQDRLDLTPVPAFPSMADGLADVPALGTPGPGAFCVTVASYPCLLW